MNVFKRNHNFYQILFFLVLTITQIVIPAITMIAIPTVANIIGTSIPVDGTFTI